MQTQSRLTTVLVVGMLLLSTVALASPAVAADDGDGGHTLEALEDGEDLYLVFGADLEDTTLEEFIEENADGNPSPDADSEAIADVVQYQDVEQVNLNQQEGAVSISIDGGEATAIQEASQDNTNTQEGDAVAQNQELGSHTTDFENVGNVYLIIGENGDQFDGYGIAGEEDGDLVCQEAVASITQEQAVGQVNYNQQSTAFALAENESEATAFQQSSQANENLQEGASNSTNVAQDLDDHGDDKKSHDPEHHKKGDDGEVGQSATAGVAQAQQVAQTNVNEQGTAVAIAVGNNTTSTAVQLTEQTNLNEQFATAEATNIIEAMSGMNVATAGIDDGNDVISQDEDIEHEHHKADKKDDGDGDQFAESSVTQFQGAEQVNLNLQSTAAAIAVNGSEATAVQLAYQQNYNAQVGFAEATNVGAGSDLTYSGVTYTDQTSLIIGGEDVNGSPMMAFDYDGSQQGLNTGDQYSSADVEQVQFVVQENLNEQQGAIAVAEDDGEAGAVQISMQENENVQFATVAAGTPALP